MAATKCENCPLRRREVFRPFTREEEKFISTFKTGELVIKAGHDFLVEGEACNHIFTVLSGWGMRMKELEDGRRQILNFVLPGDLVGLQGAVLTEMEHSVQALSDMVVCVFNRSGLWTLFDHFPSLAYDITWLSAREEQMLDSHLLTVGRRHSLERIAYLFVHIFERARTIGMIDGNRLDLPITQQHVADMLGLSLVHTNKTLRRMTLAGLLTWRKGQLTILDEEGLRQAAQWETDRVMQRPLI